MYLKAIELENFKSFARKTRIELREGFTAISGPNGSGKSNIGDAILFVLGPKSSKVIRAQKLTDLIHDGGKSGKPADYCRVSLIFDNRDRILPIDESEVKLTRYVKRANNEEGYNSYFYINDEKARLQDFISLLNHARIDADGYNFVQQGDITNIVKMTPVERRVILDDIAGITKFDDEIRKAEEKKRNTEENMGRVEVILQEIKKHLDELEKDRETALKYRELEEKLKETNAKIAYSKMMNSRENMDSYSRQVENIEKDIENLKNEIEKKKGEEEEILKEKEKIDKKMNEMGGEEIREIKDKIDNIKIEIARVRTRVENREDRIRENEDKIKNMKKDLKEIREKIRDMEKEEMEKNRELKEKTRIYEEKKRKYEEEEKKIGEANKKVGELQKSLGELMKEIEKKRDEYHTKILEENKLKEKINDFSRRIAEREEEEKNIDMAIKDANWRISQFRDERKDFEKKRKKLEEEYYNLRNEEVRLKKELDEKNREIGNLNREYEKMKGRMESRDPLTMAVMAILNARDQGLLKGIYGTIAELGEVDEKYELAIEIAAGGRMRGIVCEDDESAARGIEYLKKNKIGRAIFLPLNKMLRGRPRGKAILASRDPSAVGFAIDLIKFDKKFESAFWYVFGDTVVVDNLDNARKLMGGVRLVTLDGQLIEASGAMLGGNVEKKRKISMGSMEKIGEKLRNLLEERDSIESHLNDIGEKIDGITEKIREMKMNDSNEKIEIWKKEKEKNEKKREEIKKDINELKNEREGYKKILNDIHSEVESISQDIEKLVNREKEIESSLNSLVPENIAEEINNLKEEVSSLREYIENIHRDLVEIRGNLKNLREREKNMKNEIDNFSRENEKFGNENEEDKKKIENMNIERRKLEEVVKKEEEKLKNLMDRRDSLLSKKMELDKEIGGMKNDIHVKEEMVITLNTRIKEYGERYEEARREYESYGVEVSKVESVSKLQKYENEIQTQMSLLGPVNMKSIDDYDREMERYDKLKKDYSNLSKEKRELENLVKELNGKKKSGLLKVFNAINENFKRIYREISEGGEAELVLENMDNPFKGGLIMKVKPIGKRLRILTSLSGGEKSLAALSFIFAIQQYEPSPIYLLDEVDMFLDGVNAEIVGRIIKRNSRSAQFIVISLRKATIKFADYVIGVTHKGDGISKVFMQTVPVEAMENA